MTFTGSNEIGSYLRAALAGRNVRLQSEIGGKNASVVLADADLDLAAATMAGAAFGQAGQRCTATSRLIVEASVAAALTERLRGRVAAASSAPASTRPPRWARWLTPSTATACSSTSSGPRPRGRGYPRRRQAGVRRAVARLLRGADAGLRHPRQALWRDEVFGPVVAVSTASGFDDAVELANDSGYGLAAAVFTTSLRWPPGSSTRPRPARSR